ncbi:MAG: ABC transporter permease [Dehalococcoidales bacterium]|nr:ABC transporter permease [Dehalococcoidales bacterium]
MRYPSWRFFRLWQRNRDVFFRLWHSEGAGAIIEPILVLLAFGMGMGAFIGDIGEQRYIEFLAPGIIIAYAMFAASFECTYGSYFRMEHHYTFDAILATPLNVEDITAGEIFWGATRSFMTGCVILAIAAAFQLVPSFWALLIPLVAALSGVMFASISLFVTSIVPSIYTFNFYFTLVITPMFLLAGVFFPLTRFPDIVQKLSWIAPLTPAAKLTRGLFQGEFHADMLLALGVIIAWAVVFFGITLVTMRRRLTK